MFSVLFEVKPHPQQWDSYLDYATMLRPELEEVDGFVDNIRYRSLTRDGWILSLSNWRDEKALVRWRTRARHHDVQIQGRETVFCDYRLRVGQLTHDTQLPAGQALVEQRLDETEVGEATTITLVDTHAPDQFNGRAAEGLAERLGLERTAAGLISWDVYEAVRTPGDFILTLSWRAHTDAENYEGRATPPPGARIRRVRVIRHYGMYDRRENPQYYPDVPPRS